MVRRVLGILVFSIGLLLAGWVAYNLLFQLQPEARGTSPLPAIVLSALFMWVGFTWIRGREAG